MLDSDVKSLLRTLVFTVIFSASSVFGFEIKVTDKVDLIDLNVENEKLKPEIVLRDGLPMISLKDLWAMGVGYPSKVNTLPGVYGLEFTAYLDQTGDPLNKSRSILWSYQSTNQQAVLMKYLNTSSLPRGQVTTFRIWLPNFDINNHVHLNTFFRDIEFSIGRDYGTIPLYLNRLRLVKASEFDSISASEIYSISDMKSLMDQALVQNLLILYYLLFFAYLLLNFARKLRIQFAFGFIMIPFSLGVFLFYHGGSLLRSYEQNLVETTFSMLQSDFYNSFQISEEATRLFRKDLQQQKLKLANKLEPFVQKLKASEITSKEFNNKVHHLLLKFKDDTSIRFTIYDGAQIYASCDTHSSIQKARYKLMYQVINLFYQNKKEFSKSFEKRKVITKLLDKFRKNLSTQGFIDTYLNRKDTPCQVAVRRQDIQGHAEKEFWSRLNLTKSDVQLVLFGNLKPKAYSKLYMNAYKNLSNDSSFNSKFYFSGVHDTLSFPFENHFSDRLEIFAQKARLANSPLKGIESYNGQLFFYLADLYPLDNSFSVVAYQNVSKLFQKLIYLKNLFFVVLVLFPVLLFAFCSKLAKRITEPMEQFSKSLDKVASGVDPGYISLQTGDEIASLSQEAERFLNEILEKKSMSQFLSKILVQSLEGERSSSSRQKAVVIFCSFASNKSPASLDNLKTLFECSLNCIDEFGGYHDKFTGHATLGFFLEDKENFLHHSLKCCIKLHDLLNEKLSSDCQVGIGIYYGSLILGEVGSANRRDFTGIGASVNRSARIQGFSITTGTNIACNQEYFINLSLEDQGRFQSLGKFALKGIEEEQEIYGFSS